MNYKAIAVRASKLLSKYGSGQKFKLIEGGGTVMVGGVEQDIPESVADITGFVRKPTAREVDGDAIVFSDWLGDFTNDVEIRKGSYIEIYGERYVVTDPRPLNTAGVVVCYRPVMRRVAVHA